MLSDANLQKVFIDLTANCTSVVCCRLTPGQKAQTLRLIKQSNPTKITAAIGDGANDVPMLREAHVGIGIYGLEGMQAVQSSDFAIGEFKFLWRLLLVHGRLNYINKSEMILYCMYKNAVLTLPQVLFAFANGYSGHSIYDDLYIANFNFIFTALPYLMRALFDQDINVKLEGYWKHKTPIMYSATVNNNCFNYQMFKLNAANSIINSCIVYFVPVLILGWGDQYTMSLASFTSLVLVVNLNLLVNSKYITLINMLSVFLTSILPYFLFVWKSNYIQGSWMQNVVGHAI